MTKKQIEGNRLLQREKRLRALAEVVRDCNDCVGADHWTVDEGGCRAPTPAEHADDCLHCMAKWALTGRYPRPER